MKAQANGLPASRDEAAEEPTGRGSSSVRGWPVSEGCTYEDLGGDFFAKRDTDRQRQRAIAQLEALGYKVSLKQVA